MKPNRHLQVPSHPHYAVEIANEKGIRVAQLPEFRIPKLLKTKRFKAFLGQKNEDGTLEWLKPEVAEGDTLTPESIRPEKIALAPKDERELRQFNDDLYAAQEEQSGEVAFKFYEKYVQLKVVVDGELASQKFLGIAVERRWPAAIEVAKVVGGGEINAIGLSASQKADIINRLAKVENPQKVVRLLDRALKLGINGEKFKDEKFKVWTTIGVGQVSYEWALRAERMSSVCACSSPFRRKFKPKNRSSSQ